MKKLLLMLTLALSGASWLFAQPCAFEADAKAAADKLYAKGETFAQTFEKTRPQYAKWAEEQKKSLAPEVSFAPWRASVNLKAFPGNIAEALNPLKNPVDENAVYGGGKVWEIAEIQDGEPFNLQKYNPRFTGNYLIFLERGIEAKKDMRIAVSFAHMQVTEVFLNGKSVYKAGKYWNGYVAPSILTLDLKKGKNTLIFKFEGAGDKDLKLFYFNPYADPAIFLAQKAEADFPEFAQALKNVHGMSNSTVLPALFAASDNRGSLSSPIDAKFRPTDFYAYPLDFLIERSMFSAGELERRFNASKRNAGESAFIERIKIFEDGVNALKVESLLGYDIANVRRAMEDIARDYPDYGKDKQLFGKLADFEKRIPAIKKGILSGDAQALKDAEDFRKFADSALLANPILKNYKNWILVKRHGGTRSLGLPQNWQGNSALLAKSWRSNGKRDENAIKSFKDELWSMDISKPGDAKLLFKPEKDNAIMDLDVSYDGKKVLYSTIDDRGLWQIDELDLDSKKVRNITPRIHDKIDNYDGVYLPDGRILYCSTACFVGVPCVTGIDYVPNLYVLDPDAGSPEDIDNTIRQLTFEQDADWMPVVLDNGRILYTRWEYTDNSHYFARILMHMNPDGTAQSSFYGSTSYWPNSLFYCRQIPNDPNKFVGIVSGHHGVARAGELHMFDVSKGTKEESGRVHKFPSYGRDYEARIVDQLVDGKWPRVLHPYPLSEKFIVASVQQAPGTPYGIYLIDKFDNMTLLKKHDSGGHMFEPMPAQARKKPTEIMDKTDPDIDYGYVFLNDIYQGEGLKGVPRGTVKELRIFEYHYCYRDTGGHDLIGNEGSWDVKRIHGTVPVAEDGSAMFKVPANRPIAIQPLDKDGKALALMRSWFTVMPGEVQSCVGCHEGQGMSPTSAPALAARKKPADIKEFIAGVRGYSFVRDVQPVLDRYCVGCHDGSQKGRPNFARNLKGWRGFPKSYLSLHPYVRRSGPESNQNMLSPLEFYADTSELIQMLKKGHNGVKLDAQSMKILTTWIDLNVPCYGTWTEVYGKIPDNGIELRKKYLAKYANRHDNPEEITYDGGVQKFQQPAPAPKHPKTALKADGFPFDAEKAKAMKAAVDLPENLAIDLPNGISMRLVLIPAGSYVMGSNDGFFDEGPASVQKVEKPFYMGQFEVTNLQYSAFDKNHSSGHLDRHYKDHINKGYPANEPDQSVIRVSWNEASEFCKWLSEKCGVEVSLPTEKQWEWAARGGSDKDFWFGKLGDNYGAFENFCDAQAVKFAVNGIDPQPRVNPEPELAFVPYDSDVDDGNLVMANVGSYKQNPFGLYDMQGNVCEWTSDNYSETLGGRPVEGKKVVRGGSWRDRAKWARVSIRKDYAPWQKVYNVGIRVVVNDAAAAAKKLRSVPPMQDSKLTRLTVPLKDNVAVSDGNKPKGK